MTASAHFLLDEGGQGFSPDAARRIHQTAQTTRRDLVVIDFDRVERITTAAFAELVVLRRKLLAEGCDLHVANLTGQVAALYGLCRLESALPLAHA